MKRITQNSCPICESRNIKETLELEDFSISKESYVLHECADCSLLFTQNPPSEEDIGSYYKSEEYISHSNTKKGIVSKLYHSIRDIMLKKKHTLIKSVSNGDKLLDIGTGTGYFLNYMNSNGYDTTGIEINPEARQFGIDNFGLQIFDPSVFLSKKLNKKFDTITLWHVLEHIYDLDQYLDTINDSLNKDGVLIVAVPNHQSFDAQHYKKHWSAYDVPRHLWHFSPTTMRKLMSKHKFDISKIKMLPFDSFYVSMLSEKLRGNSLSFIRGFFIGLVSYLKGALNNTKASSVIYIIKKSS